MQATTNAFGSAAIRLPRVLSLLHYPLVLRSFVFCAVAAALAAVWSPFAPARLYDFDAANFALALDDFQPGLHQPQPPGYPLYVGLTKLIHLAVEDVSLTFLIAGLLGATAAIVSLWLLGECMFGRKTGIFAALLLMTNPILWQTGMSDQVRIYIAVISIGVALAVWPLFEARRETPHRTRRFATSCLLLGFLAGFRPEMLVSMAPLLLIAAWRSRLRLLDWLAGIFALAAGMAPWTAVLLSKVGGLAAFLTLMQVYSAQQAGGSSVLFGASWAGAWKMLSAGLWWASLGIAAWIPAALITRWRSVSGDGRLARGFLLAWFLPLFLFSIVVHIAASGHSLGFIPVLCLAGGWVLSRVGETRGWQVMIVCLAAALALNVLFFFKPYSRAVKEASYKTVGVISFINETVLDRMDILTQGNDAFLVTDSQWISWRELEYYYPKTPVLYLPNSPATSNPVWLFQNRQHVRDLDPATEMMLPACGTIAWLIADDDARKALLAVEGAEAHRYYVATPAQPGMHFTVGGYRLATGPHSCR